MQITIVEGALRKRECREKVSIDADFCVSIRPIHFPENETDAGWRNKRGNKAKLKREGKKKKRKERKREKGGRGGGEILWKEKKGKGREEKEKKQSIGKIAPSKTSCNVRNSNRFYRGGHG